MKAVIIGGGVGGLCTALALRQNGVTVELYEQAPEPRAVGAGLVLWPNAVRVLRQLGIDEAITTGYVNLSSAIHRWDGMTLSHLDPQAMIARYGAPTIAVHREDLLHILLGKVGDAAHYGKRLSSYQQDKSGVTAVFEDGSSASGDVLIGADGIHSRVRGQMQPQSRPVYRGYAAWRGILSFPHERAGTMWGESWGRGLRFGIIPLSRERVYWFATMNRPASSPPDDHKTLLRALFRDWHQPIPEIIEATPDEHLLYNDIADLEPLSSWSDGRVTLLGDAAHAMSPNMGQGACQAIEDAVTLAQMMRQQANVTDAIQAYQADRMPHTRKVVLRSRQIGQMGQLTNPLLIELRNTAIRSMPERMRWQQFDFVLAHGQQ